MKGYNVLSLFGGIETGYAALVDAGVQIENYWSSEIDKCAIKVTSVKYPQVKHLGDVVKFARYFCASPKNIEKIKQYQHVTAKTLRTISQVEEIKANGVDLCIGGSPCQGFSFAGKQLNFKDPRSALFFEYAKVLSECKRINPNLFFLLENVPMKKEHSDIISKYIGLAISGWVCPCCGKFEHFEIIS
jgi:DNA (cytosine-5)-methyltransferase 1